MDCNAIFIKRRKAAESLLSAAIGIGLVSLLFLSLAAIYLYSTRSFAEFGNYADLDANSRLALDMMSRDIRQADYVKDFSSNSITFQSGANELKFSYNPTQRVVLRQLGSSTTPLLWDCDDVRYSVFARNPTNSVYDFYPEAASPTNGKVVQVTVLCTLSLLERKANSTTVQSAKIVI